MSLSSNLPNSSYWEEFQIHPDDLDFIKNHLYEQEKPQSIDELLPAMVSDRIRREKLLLVKQQDEKGRSYLPKDSYKVGDHLVFSALNWAAGTVQSVRPALNPEYPPFKVIEVDLGNGSRRFFASELEAHALNNPGESIPGMEYLDADLVMRQHAGELAVKLKQAMQADEELVSSAARWFHRSLLIDISVGQLNLAEAVLDMAGGGPLATSALSSQLDLPAGVDATLLDFSLNRAFDEDPRFDEVGPAGEILWFLEKLEPDDVRTVPIYLQHPQEPGDLSRFSPPMLKAMAQLDDDPQQDGGAASIPEEVQVTLSYPHWRAGTLPLSNRTDHLFPIAFEAPRIRFPFVDADSKEVLSGWVVRPHRYVAGLRQWYLDSGVIPGSQITIQKANAEGLVVINANKKRPAKEWVRTALVGADGGIVLALLKQQVTTLVDEQMTIAIPDVEALDGLWAQSGKNRITGEQAILRMSRELTKLNPQGHIHAIELYSAVNLVRRIPLADVFTALQEMPAFSHVGDLYYRMDEEAAGS